MSFFAIISFIGICYYSIWVIILIFNSIKNPKYGNNFKNINLNLKLFILVPMLNEANIVNKTLTSFLENTRNLPQVKFFIIDDASDDGTSDIVQLFINKHNCRNKIHLIRRIPPMAQTGKGDSLNWGLKYLRTHFKMDETQTIIGILDADATIYEQDIKKILLQFSEDKELALLQTKIRMINPDNWLQKMQDIEFATINDWIQRTRNKIHNAAASGNGQFIRMSAVSNNNQPWGNALLEDFEFSIRFLLMGKKTLYRTDIVVYQEAIKKVIPFIRQRSRWVQGGIDCILTYIKPIIYSSKLVYKAKFEMIFFMLLPFITCLVGLSNFIVLWFALIHIKIFEIIIMILIIINFVLATYIAIKYKEMTSKLSLKLILDCGGLAIYNILLFPAILIAFYRKVSANQKWIKTTHGNI